MIYNNFRINCIVRLALLTATIFVFFLLLLKTDIYLTTIIAGAAILVQAYLLLRYIESFTRSLARFLSSIRYSDFTISFKGRVKGAGHGELYNAFNDVLSEFKKTRAEKEEQYRYLQVLVEHIGLGIISFERDGQIDLINRSAKRLLRIGNLTNISDLEKMSESLVKNFRELGTGERGLVKVNIEGEKLTLALSTTKIKFKHRTLTLASLQNIESELAEQEMAAWQKLIRVLNHEIMNSVTPLASLAGTARGLTEKVKTGKHDDDTIDDIFSAVTVMESRSQGLLRFIESYRRLTRIPDPHIQMFEIRPLLDRALHLLGEELQGVAINTRVFPENLKLMADQELIEQVLINVILNGIRAVNNQKDARIEITAWTDENERKSISISDNGVGIGEEIREKIFTPFFTTGKDGSGIGLSLSKQIMRKHGGNIEVKSEVDQYTTFTLIF